MTRYDFGGDGTQAIFDLTTGKPLQNATDGVVYASLTATSPLVDITADQGGTTFLDNVTTNVHGVLGRFYGPDNVKQVAVDFGSGERFLIDSNTGRRDALNATTDIQAALDMADAAIPSASMGQPLGPAQLGSDGRLPYEQLPTDIGVGGPNGGSTVVVNGKAGPDITLTPGDVGARPSATPVPAADVSGLSKVATSGAYADLTGAPNATALAKVATSGAYADLTGTPAPAVPLSSVGAVYGVASLDPSGKLPKAQLPVLDASLITDATTVGRSVLTAADVASARTAIGAGTSNLAVGTTPTSAKRGDYAPTIADLPAGVVLSTTTTTRPTSRTDLKVIFDTGATDPGTAALEGDVWFRG